MAGARLEQKRYKMSFSLSCGQNPAAGAPTDATEPTDKLKICTTIVGTRQIQRAVKMQHKQIDIIVHHPLYVLSASNGYDYRVITLVYKATNCGKWIAYPPSPPPKFVQVVDNNQVIQQIEDVGNTSFLCCVHCHVSTLHIV